MDKVALKWGFQAMGATGKKRPRAGKRAIINSRD
jgi:hypothetical protein